jgi:hypothetical protein
VGAPTSFFPPEMCVQYLENSKIFGILLKHCISMYFQYFDGILLVYQNSVTNINEVLNTFNDLTQTVEEELGNKINLIYGLPSATDFIIPIDSCHPPEHKLAAVRYLTNRLSTYPMNETYTRNENDTMKEMLYNNKYNTAILNKIIRINDAQEQKEERKHRLNGPKSHELDDEPNLLLSYSKTLISKSLSRPTIP